MNNQGLNPPGNLSWDETILFARRNPEFAKILHDSYLGVDAAAEAQRFYESPEYQETLLQVRRYSPMVKTVLDIGAGSGISSFALSRSGFDVTAVDPDPSEITGCGAILKLQTHFHLQNFKTIRASGEKLPFPNEQFDLVYMRQAMHHANDLSIFIAEAARVLNPGGYLFAMREHVVFDENDKQRFLGSHPFQKYYGGENAFTLNQYLAAFTSAGLTVELVLKYFDSSINYFPRTEAEIKSLPEKFKQEIRERAIEKFGMIGKLGITQAIYAQLVSWIYGGPLDERSVEGRMYSFILKK